MKSMRTAFLLLAPLTLAGAGSAMAGTVVEAEVPFAFTVRDQVLPAGEYRVERSAQDPAVLIIKGEHGVHASVMTNTKQAREQDPAGEQCALVFTREGNGYRLRDVWEDRYDGQEIPTR